MGIFSTILSVAGFIVLLFAVVLLHELGHFLVAKFFKIEIEEFGIGFPPKVKRLFTWRGTAFYLNALPLGGYNLPKQDPDTGVDAVDNAPFLHKNSVYLAGSLVNLITAFLAYAIIFASIGVPIKNAVVVQSVLPNTPADGVFMADDRLVAINQQKVASIDHALEVIRSNRGNELEFTLKRGEEVLTKRVTIRTEFNPKEGSLGIRITNPQEKMQFSPSIQMAADITATRVVQMFTLPYQLIANPSQNVTLVGLKGMYEIYRDSTEVSPASQGQREEVHVLIRVLEFFASMSLSIGTINLFPFPALDGGRVLLSLPELVLRRKLPQRITATINIGGFAMLMLLMISINVFDFLPK